MPTLRQYRRATTDDLGSLEILTTTSLAGSTSELVCSTLIDGEMAAQTYAGGWVYVVDGAQAGVQRRLVEAALDRTTGTLTTARAFGGAIASGVVFELSTRLPPHENAFRLDAVRSCINQTLRAIWYVDRLPIPGVSDQYEYTLTTAYPWLTKASRIRRVFSPIATVGEIPHEYRGPVGYRQDGEAYVLELRGAPFKTGETFWVEALRPGNSRLKKSGVWTDQTDPLADLTADADEAPLDVNDVKAGALYYAYRNLAKSSETAAEVEEWTARAKTQAAIFRDVKRKHLPQVGPLGRLEMAYPGRGLRAIG